MATSTTTRKRPNVLITGTPGVGKTTTASMIAEKLGMTHVNVGEIIEEIKCYEGRDEELDTYVLDEDKLLDHVETVMTDNVVADFHMCELFPERWFDLVLVLRSSTDVLYDRLIKRGYSGKKLEGNMQSEIMQVVLEEATEAYDSNIVHAVQNDSLEDMESNVDRVRTWIDAWIKDNVTLDDE